MVVKPAYVLVVDDEPSLSELVGAVLRYEGFEVAIAATAAQAVASARNRVPDLILLDVMLPDDDGFSVQRRLAADRIASPIVFLSARDAPPDKVRALTDGADDYVTKPFNVEELVARVRAVLRRSGTTTTTSSTPQLQYADLVIDDDLREVRRGEDLIELTLTEYRLLHFLVANAPRVLHRSQLLEHVWGFDFDGDTSIVETYIFYLRRKIDSDPTSLIRTVRGVGYGMRAIKA